LQESIEIIRFKMTLARHLFLNLSITSLLGMFLLTSTVVLHAQPVFFDHSAKTEVPWVKHHYVIEHTDSLIDFAGHSSLNYRLNVERESRSVVHFNIEVRSTFPKPEDPFPLTVVSDELQPYLNPSRYINSDHQKIKHIADSIHNAAPVHSQYDLVWRVIQYTAAHLSWGNPSDLPSAMDALEQRVVNCIGYTHLPAAILRHLGIPARTVRTFLGLRLTPHYLLEVYYPSEDDWITYDPQSGVPNPANIALYVHHDWDFEGQRRTRPLVTDPNIKVYLGR